MHRTIAILALAAAAVPRAAAQGLGERMAGVSSAQAAEERAAKVPLLRSLLATGVSVDFRDTPAREAFARLRDVLRIDMEVRWSGPNSTQPGFDPDAPVTLQVRDASGLSVLERMIDIVATEPSTWQLRRQGFVEVGPKSRLASPAAQETRVEPVGDLLMEVPDFTNAPEFNLNQAVPVGSAGGVVGGGGGFGGGFGGGGGSPFGDDGGAVERTPEEVRAMRLVQLITTTVEPDAWLDPQVATISYFEGNLVIRAPDFVHRQINGYPGVLPPPARGSGGRYAPTAKPTTPPGSGAAPAAPAAPPAPGAPPGTPPGTGTPPTGGSAAGASAPAGGTGAP